MASRLGVARPAWRSWQPTAPAAVTSPMPRADQPDEAAQAAQMQARRWAGAGTRASSCGAKRTRVHQHGCGAPLLARAACSAQPLGAPHSGQRAGSTAGGSAGVSMSTV